MMSACLPYLTFLYINSEQEKKKIFQVSRQHGVATVFMSSVGVIVASLYAVLSIE